MVVGKAGRAETPTDPAPLDMIETMVNFRPRELWPRRKLAPRRRRAPGRARARRPGAASGLIAPPDDATALDRRRRRRPSLPVFDAADARVRLSAEPRVRPRARRATGRRPRRPDVRPTAARWREHVARLDAELLGRARRDVHAARDRRAARPARRPDPSVAAVVARSGGSASGRRAGPAVGRAQHHAARRPRCRRRSSRCPRSTRSRTELAAVVRRAACCSGGSDRDELAGFGGDLDRAVQMPGWTNVWTMPIQNRVDMLATGVNTAVGVRVLGRTLDDVVRGLGGRSPPS